MIPAELLKATEGRAPGCCVYGAAGLKKTHGICTAPPPILMLDVGEGGTASVVPWIRRKRNWNSSKWLEYTDEDRQLAVDLLREDVRLGMFIKPAPYIDVIHYDNSDADAWTQLAGDIGSFDYNYYNTLATDSLQEFSVATQSHAKGKGNELAIMNSVNFSWVGAQERAAMALRKQRNYRDMGVFIYTTASEDIAKDYVKNPMEKGSGGETPYSIRGTVNLPGKLAEAVPHLPDLVFHAKLINNQVQWVAEPEPLTGGAAWWDAKDRYGRLPKYNDPNFRKIFRKLYGDAGMEAIYACGKR
jgi:hypothetical protein